MLNLQLSYTHSTPTNTLLCGKLDIKQDSSNFIICPPDCEYKDFHITLDSNCDSQFKSIFKQSQVLPSSYTLYDQSGFINCNYQNSRNDNNPGNITNNLEPKVLLSDITIPIIKEGQQFLVISSYSGLTNLTLTTHKKHLVTKDLELFSSKYDLSKIILFIVDNIQVEISNFCDLNNIFKQVHVYSQKNVIKSLVEFISGTCINGSNPEFQGMLNFDSDVSANVEIVSGHFINIKSDCNISTTIRRGGRIHITSNTPFACIYFIIVISHTLKIHEFCESTTNQKFTLNIVPDKLNDLTKEQLQIIMNSILYVDRLDKISDSKELVQYFLSNELFVVEYLFDSPILKNFSIKNEESDIFINNIISSYMLSINNKIRNKIINHSENNTFKSNDIYSHYYSKKFIPKPMIRQFTEFS